MSDEYEEKRPRININFNRKILAHGTLQTLKDTLDAQGQIKGEAVEGVIEDLQKLRYLCEEIVLAYNNGDITKIQKAVELLRMVI